MTERERIADAMWRAHRDARRRHLADPLATSIREEWLAVADAVLSLLRDAVRARTEECARACDAERREWEGEPDAQWAHVGTLAAIDCAARIRALPDTETDDARTD